MSVTKRHHFYSKDLVVPHVSRHIPYSKNLVNSPVSSHIPYSKDLIVSMFLDTFVFKGFGHFFMFIDTFSFHKCLKTGETTISHVHRQLDNKNPKMHLKRNTV